MTLQQFISSKNTETINQNADLATVNLPKQFAKAEDIITYYENESVADHPLLQRLVNGAANPAHVWILVKNIDEGISQTFVGWLAHVIAIVDDNRIRSIITRQLDEELGEGNYSRSHRLLFERFLLGLEPWKPRNTDVANLVVPVQKFKQNAERYFLSSNPYEALGAAIVSEVIAKQFDIALYEAVKRQEPQPSRWHLAWLTLHVQLEVHHAEESSELAHLLPNSSSIMKALTAGSVGMSNAFRQFLDDINQVCLA